MRYLVDGYNLMHALLGPPAGPNGLEAARRRLLDRLLELPGVAAADLLVVFDARRAQAGRPTRSYRGVELVFAHDRTADELIEDLVRRDASPATLTVVSDDHRVQNAARRRSCGRLDCLDWIDQMKRARPAERPPGDAEKPDRAGDADEWLRAFGSADTLPVGSDFDLSLEDVLVDDAGSPVEIHLDVSFDEPDSEPFADAYSFSVFNPTVIREAEVGQVMVFCHLEGLAEEAANLAAERMDLRPENRLQVQSARLARSLVDGQTLRVGIDVPGLKATPDYADLAVWEPLQSVEFRFRAEPRNLSRILRGVVTCSHEGIPLAALPIEVCVLADTQPDPAFRPALARQYPSLSDDLPVLRPRRRRDTDAARTVRHRVR